MSTKRKKPTPADRLLAALEKMIAAAHEAEKAKEELFREGNRKEATSNA